MPFVPESVCSRPCGPKEVIQPKSVSCCWTCTLCRKDEILVDNSTACQSCPIFTWPDDVTATICLPIVPYNFNEDGLAFALVSIATVILIIVLLIVGLFIKYRNTKIVKATSFNHSLVILTAVAATCIDVILICKTEMLRINCIISYSLFHLSVSLLFAPLLIKNIRVYRIFTSGKKGHMRLRFISNKIQLMFIASIVLIQVNSKANK